MLDRIASMWSVATSLITSGIRKCHPNSIITVFNSVVIPKLLYGLELVKLNKSDHNYLNTQARICLKSLFGISKRSKNILNQIYNLKEVTTLINTRKLKMFRSAIHNKSISPYLFHLLTSNKDISYSYLHSVKLVAQSQNLDLTSLILNKHYKTNDEVDDNSTLSEDVNDCIRYINSWHLLESRIAFRARLEEYVLRP